MPIPRTQRIHIQTRRTSDTLDEKKALREAITERDEKIRKAKDLAFRAEMALLRVDHNEALGLIREIKSL